MIFAHKWNELHGFWQLFCSLYELLFVGLLYEFVAVYAFHQVAGAISFELNRIIICQCISICICICVNTNLHLRQIHVYQILYK